MLFWKLLLFTIRFYSSLHDPTINENCIVHKVLFLEKSNLCLLLSKSFEQIFAQESKYIFKLFSEYIYRQRKYYQHRITRKADISLEIILNVFEGATKFYFTHYSCAVIILFIAGLYKTAFSTDCLGKLAFCLSEIFVLSQIELDVTFINLVTLTLHNHCLYKYVALFVLFSLISKKRYTS